MRTEAKPQVSFAPSSETEDVREKLHGRILRRQASLSPAEAFFLHGLLIDDDDEPSRQDGKEEEKEGLLNGLKQAVKVLDDEILFSVPEPLVKLKRRASSASEVKANLPRRPSRILSLWLAHEEGVAPRSLVKRGSRVLSKPFQLGDLTADSLLPQESADDEDDIASDDSVRDDDNVSECSSWDDSEHQDHYSAWEILKDEYAKDFGFDYTTPGTVADILNDDADTHAHVFKILGTSADDQSAQPHVLSPPLMDSLMTFLPDNLVNENYWLKFSLVRDGACLDTLKQYCRASTYTIIAIETRKGQVFGCFTSQPWRNHFGFYGSAPSFVWKMRHSRKTKCHSLFDQAQLESEIDVFMFTGGSALLQVCRHDALALGGDDSVPHLDDYANLHDAVKATEKTGFALALEEDLMIGTTSPSPTFSSPSLCGVGDKTETFEVMNLEVWTFTPCADVNAAERLEMSKFFIEESSRTTQSSVRSANSTRNSPQFTSRDLDQQQFYRRVGQDSESEERRERWQYLNMMNPTDGKRGIGASPRFSS